jgi:uncharacterized membrane protein YGL010W
MPSLSELFDEYSESHRHPQNKLIHWICVPLIVWSLLGMIWTVPVPVVFNDLNVWVNWATLSVAVAMVYYLLHSWSLAVGLLIILIFMLLPLPWFEEEGISLLKLSLCVFIVAWVGQFIGHIIEGKRPSFLKDLQFLLIGPLWLLAHLYRKLHIPY